MKKTLAIFLTLSMLFAAGVCGTAAAASDAEPGPVGGYMLTGIAGGSGSSLEIVSAVVDLGAKFYLFLREDGTGSMNFLEAEIPLAWDESCIIISYGETDPIRIPYSCEDGFLNLSTRAYSMDFNPLTDEQLVYYEENGAGSLGGITGRIVQDLLDSMDGGLIDGLLFAVEMGAEDSGSEPIPEGKPSEEPVTGVVDGVEYTVLGTGLLQDGEDSLIIFYFNATNISDDIRGPKLAWYDAAQGGEFLDPPWDVDLVPEQYNVNYDLYPGRTILCALAYFVDPDGGVVGFRISSFDEDNTVLYYADPQNPDGAPEEPFVFDADYTIPEELKELPEETEHVSIENVEFYTAEDGSDAVRFSFRYLSKSAEDGKYHSCIALQDGIELRTIWSEIDFYSADEAEDRLRIYPCALRTESPVVLLILEETEDGTVIEAARFFELD